MDQAVARCHKAWYAPTHHDASTGKGQFARCTLGFLGKGNATCRIAFLDHVAEREARLEQAAHRRVRMVASYGIAAKATRQVFK